MSKNNNYIFNAALHSGVTNSIINGICAWLLSGGKVHLPVYGSGGVFADFLATTAILIFILTLIVLPLQRKKAPANMQVDAPLPAFYKAFFSYMSSFRNSVIAGLLTLYGFVLMALFLLLAFPLFEITELSRLSYSVSKGVLMGMVSMLVTWPIIYIAIKPANGQASIILGDKS